MSLPTKYSELLQKVQRHGFPKFTLERLHHLYFNGQDPHRISCVDVCRYCHALAVAGDTIWNLAAYERIVAPDVVLAQAAAAEERRRSTTRRMWGIPVSVKANIAVASLPLTAGSRILGAEKEEAAAIGYHADVTSILLDHGAVLIGTTTMDEFGMGSLGTHVASDKAPRNPIPLLMRPRGSRYSISNNNWTDQELRHLMQLPQEAINEMHADLLHDTAESTKAELDRYAPGGSSCGSAIAVSHGSCVVALGSDTGGSIRLPATYCHTVGFKPSYGMLSRHGLVSYASSLDTIGIIASSVAGAAVTYQSLLEGQMDRQGHIRDSTQAIASASYQADMQSVVASLCDMKTSELPPSSESAETANLPMPNPLEGMRIGIPAAFSVAECFPVVRQVWLQGAQWLQQHGATVEIVSEQQMVPETLQKSLSAYYILACAEASSNLSRYDGLRYGATARDIHNELQLDDASTSLLERQYAATRTEYFGKEVIRRILCGTFVLSSDRFHTHYEAAAKLRSSLTQQFQNVLRSASFSSHDDDMYADQFDVLLIPTTIFPPPKLSSNINVNPTEMFANDIMTVPISLVGYPAISVSIRGSRWGDDDDALPPFPIGLQLVGSRKCESHILRAAAVLEQLDCSPCHTEQ